MTTERRIWLARPQLGDEELAEVDSVLRSGQLTQGPVVAAFEALVAERVGVAHAVAVTSATTALHLSLAALGIQRGDEVLVPDFTFPATANVVVQQGAVPVFVDIQPLTFALDPADLERKITARTRAVMPVHPFGLSADMDPILSIAAGYGLAVIEDAACALGAEYRGRAAGSMGAIGCFSFHPRKSITTGEGGMALTNDDGLADRLRLLRSHGGRREGGRFTFVDAGYNYRLSDILAAVGVAQIRKLDAFLAVRRGVASWYDAQLAGARRVRTPSVPSSTTHTYQSYVVTLDDGVDRDRVIDDLRVRGIETTIGTYALHAQPYFASAYGYSPGDLPVSHRAFETSLALPLHGGMTSADVDEVVERLTVAIETG